MNKEQLELQLEQPPEQTENFHRLQEQKSKLNSRMMHLDDVYNYSKRLMRNELYQIVAELQKECIHPKGDRAYALSEEDFCCACGKKLT